eukprot:10646168-Alexandrium_andersonii.AAC.1
MRSAVAGLRKPPTRAADTHQPIARGGIARAAAAMGHSAQRIQLRDQLRAQGAAPQHAQARGR